MNLLFTIIDKKRSPPPSLIFVASFTLQTNLNYCHSFEYKLNNRISEEQHLNATIKAQEYLSKLESWMDLWRLSLAPHKCMQTMFSKGKQYPNDDLNIKIYGQKIAFEHNPKFLGITFDTGLKFDKHLKKVKEKVNDRINILKVLSYVNYLLIVYKVLVRSVMDYANVVMVACNIKVVRDLGVLQNDALRVILKKSVNIQTLQQWAYIESVEGRHETLLNKYYESCLVKKKPLINELFDNYKNFKQRNKIIRESLAVSENGIVDLTRLDLLIRQTNINSLNNESHRTLKRW